MLYDNEMKLEFLSKSENEAFARVAVSAFVSQLDPNIEELADIKTSVSEAVTNSIIHGYDEKIGIIKIITMIKDNTVYIEISDEGRGIDDIDKAKQALYTSKPNMERSGLGFTIMESFMDDLEVISKIGKGTTIKMKKKIGKQSDLQAKNSRFAILSNT